MNRLIFCFLLLFSVAARAQNAAQRPELVLQLGHSNWVYAVAFSPDGQTLASGSADKTIKLWNVRSGLLQRTLIGHAARVAALSFSFDGQTLASASEDQSVKLWDVASGAPRPLALEHDGPVTSVAFAPDGRTLASASEDQTVKLWDAASGELRRTFTGHVGAVQSLAFAPDGQTLASGSADATIRVWDISNGELRRTLRGHVGAVQSLAFAPDGQTLASGGEDQSIKLWNASAGRVERTLLSPGGAVTSVAFAPDGQSLATAESNSVAIWDLPSGRIRRTLTGHAKLVWSLAFAPDGHTLATGAADNTARLWNPQNGATLRTLKGYEAPIQALTYSRATDTLASGGADATIKLWNASSGELRRTLSGHAKTVQAVAFAPDGKLLASGGADETIKLWEVRTGKLRRTLKGHRGAVQAIAFAPDGQTLASGGKDRTIKLWDVQSGALRRTLKGHDDEVLALAFPPGGKTLASGGGRDAPRIKLWNLPAGSVRRTLSGHRNAVQSLAFAPDGRTLGSGSLDGTVKLWDASSGALQRTLSGTAAGILSIAFAPDGKTLAGGSGAEAPRVKLWNVRNGALLRTLAGHEAPVSAVTFVRGQTLASASWDNTIKLWDAAPGRLLATLLPLPEALEEVRARAKSISLGDKDIAALSNEWFVATPQGFFDCSANAAHFVRWRLGRAIVPAERFYRRFRRPDLVRQALRAQPGSAPALASDDAPPEVQFVGLQYKGATAQVKVTVRVSSRDALPAAPGTLLLLVNERPQNALQWTRLEAPPASENAGQAAAKAIVLGEKAIVLGEKSLGEAASGNGATLSKVEFFTCEVPLPPGAAEVRLRAMALDRAGLSSAPAQIALRNSRAQPRAGNLYALCVGISRYRSGQTLAPGQKPAPGRFANLQYPAIDAQTMAQRLLREGAPLYDKVQVHTLRDRQASLTSIRDELKWLQKSVRPGQRDTVMVFLSGHGLSDAGGHYAFPTHEFDPAHHAATSLSGAELQRELGAKLGARTVFLFVDTCHSGALASARSDDLSFDVKDGGIYLLASSGATQRSYEAKEWGHGAFTRALLLSLGNKAKARRGVIPFDVLTYLVPLEVGRLMQQAGLTLSAEEPVVPLEGRLLDEPVVQAR